MIASEMSDRAMGLAMAVRPYDCFDDNPATGLSIEIAAPA
jgi:hypothetical protein